MTPEFSRPIRLPDRPRTITLAASAAECAALAARFGIPAIATLEAELRLEPEPGGTVRARGRLRAAVTQSCVVTLDPVEQAVEARLDLRILPEGEAPADDDPESPDEIESADGLVDLGEVAAEQLALSLDPYPRAQGAELPALPAEAPAAAPGPESPARPNPFAALAKLRGPAE